jgi:hypothetical protein
VTVVVTAVAVTVVVLAAAVTVAVAAATVASAGDPARNAPLVTVPVGVGTAVTVPTSAVDGATAAAAHRTVVVQGLPRQILLRTLLLVEPGEQVAQNIPAA